ncbi:class I SAM-dependent methyltransferase [Bradyrhizobium elkanii]|uniref:class I SAM-dependent methyltransferase n=1 Tax=Bradyrhizobium elkanii TaxID=29448 RepID=UPI003D1A289D
MNRETVNQIRFILEDLLPPIVRDSFLFRGVAKLAWGGHIDRLADFRQRATYLTVAEYEELYRDHPRVQDGTDNSQACVAQIIQDTKDSPDICDVGCGTGELLRRIASAHGPGKRYVGLDFLPPPPDDSGVSFVAGEIEKLPFEDGQFDTVLCTHTLEHILNLGTAISELRRVARRKLIIVVPMEREYKYTFNPHFNFFPYPHSLLKVLHPSPEVHSCRLIGRDLYYLEDRMA